MPVPGDLLSPAQLNRALLARQHLLDRRAGPALDVVEHLVGQQAQNAWSPYVGLWSRVVDFRHAELGDAFWDRTVTRIGVMRGTIHLVTRDDALLLPRLMAPLYVRDLQVNVLHAAALRTVDVGEVTVAARALVEVEPRVTTDLGALLAERWPEVPPGSLAYAARGTLPARPGAAARRLGQVRCDHVDHGRRLVRRRVGGPVRPGRRSRTSRNGSCSGTCAPSDRHRSPTSRAGRGSAACAPSSTGWATGSCATGPIRRRAACDRASCSTSPTGPLPDPQTPAPVRFLPDYDNVLLGHADRTRIISDEHRRALATPNGVIPATFLLDGRVAGTWAVSRGRDEPATLTVRPFAPVATTDRRAIEDEAEAFVRFMADEAVEHRVVVDG